MEAAYEDAARVEQIILTFLTSGKANKADQSDYADRLAKLLEDQPSRGRSTSGVIAELELPRTLGALRDEGWTADDTTRISSTMRRVRDILIERRVGDPGRSIKRAQANSPPVITVDNTRSAATHFDEARTQIDSAAWTGIRSRRDRLKAVRSLMPLAQTAVQNLIEELERPTGNGGPPLENRE